MIRVRPVRRALAAIAVGSVFALSACGGGGGGGNGGGNGGTGNEPATLTVGVIPIEDVAPLFVGIKKGFFKDENLTIKTQFAQGGAAIVPSVQSGDFQIGFSNTVSLLIASAKGLPVRVIAQGTQAASKKSDAWSHVYVRADSDIRSPKDLEGKKIAVNTLQNIGDVTIKAALEKKGVDVSKLKFVESPFPEMESLLKQKKVDAIWVVEPFNTVAKKAGARPISANFFETAPNLTIATYFTTQKYIDQHKSAVQRFARAMDKSLKYADAHPGAVRKALPTYTKIPKKLVGDVMLENWNPALNRASIEKLSRLSKKYGLVEQEPNLDELIWKGATG
ncbi:MAG: ABC transporter substrate-binding protein [Streptosporangiaceae bacterium]